MTATSYPDLETIRERLAERERAVRARIPSPRPPQPGRRQAARTRERLRTALYEHHRAVALADSTTHPLRRARLTFRGGGLTIKELAARAIVSPDTIQHIETRHTTVPTTMTLRRLARALDTTTAALSDDG